MVYVIQVCWQLARKFHCLKHAEFYTKNKFEKLVPLEGFVIRIYDDARSPECQICQWDLLILLISTLLGSEQQTPNLHSGGPRFWSHSEYELHWEVSHSFLQYCQANVRPAAQIRSRLILFVSCHTNCSVRILSLNAAVRAASSVVKWITGDLLITVPASFMPVLKPN